jgi:hypothetical protein
MYFIELLLTKKCNQKCHYCTTHNKDNTEVDIDYLKYVLECLPSETGVELTGGEIGLVENIEEVYRTVKNQSNIKHIIALSNGLLRKRGVDWIKDVEYWEHLIYEIKGKEIIKFYGDLDLGKPHRYVIVTTESTTKSLLTNWNYFEEMGLFRDNFFYKLMNHKSRMGIQSYYGDLVNLYNRLGNKYFSSMLVHHRIPTYLKQEKLLCESLSPNPFIDIQDKKLGHCAINIKSSDKWDFSRPMLELFRIGLHATDHKYCKDCYSFDYGRNRTKDNNRSYKR